VTSNLKPLAAECCQYLKLQASEWPHIRACVIDSPLGADTVRDESELRRSRDMITDG
jgi:hypothetical protein